MDYEIISAYKFTKIKNLQLLKSELYNFCKSNHIKGTIILAEEGINFTVSVTQKHLEKLITFLKNFYLFEDTKYTRYHSNKQPFNKLKVKIKKEIVKFGVQNLDMSKKGIYIKSISWDRLISQNDTVLIDTRNFYEYAMGTFLGALNPNIFYFSELSLWIKNTLIDKNSNIAMFCTGGIRCEKSTAYLRQLGFNNVYHLENGILGYLKEYQTKKNSKWKGKCFVFDDRVVYK